MIRLSVLSSLASKVPSNVGTQSFIRQLAVTRGRAKKSQKIAATIRNDDIPHRYKSLRVIYPDKNGSMVNETMKRNDALALAKHLKLDLVMVQEKEDPPVCRVQDAGRLIMKKESQAKRQRQKQKEGVVKEMVIGAGIDTNDLHIKLGIFSE
jgi:translation initiation factor IF-3